MRGTSNNLPIGPAPPSSSPGRTASHRFAGSLPVTGGFLLLVIAETTGAPSWVRNLSPSAHLAPVP